MMRMMMVKKDLLVFNPGVTYIAKMPILLPVYFSDHLRLFKLLIKLRGGRVMIDDANSRMEKSNSLIPWRF